MMNWLRTYEYQHVIAIVAGVLGLMMSSLPLIFSRFFAIGLAALAVGMATTSEVEAQLGNQLGKWGSWAIGFEGAVVTAVACYIGFDGFQLQVGCAFGLVVAHIAQSVVETSTWTPLKFLVLYNVCGLLGVIFVAVGRRKAFALVGLAVGSLLFTSLIGYSAIGVFTRTSPLAWIDFVEAMVVGSQPFTSLTDKGPLARYLLLGLWAGTMAIGLMRWSFIGSGTQKDGGQFRVPFLASGAGAPLPPPPQRPKRSHRTARVP